MNPDIKIGDYVKLKFGDIGRVIYVDDHHCVILNQMNDNHNDQQNPICEVSDCGYDTYQAGFEDIISKTINDVIEYINSKEE